MIWPFIGFEFVLMLASYLRWLRVAQQEGYLPGRLIAAMQRATAGSRRDGLHLMVVMLLAVVGLFSVVVAFIAAALWFIWPRSVPLTDRDTPLVWDGAATRVAVAIAVLHLLLTSLLVLVTSAAPFYAVSLLPLSGISVAALALKIAGPRAAAA